MPYIYLISTVLFSLGTGFCNASFNRKNAKYKGAAQLYCLIFLSTVFLYWLVQFLINGTYDIAVLPYSLLFAACYATSSISGVMAIRVGPIMLTSLFGQLSMIGVAVWGFIFWGESITWTTIVGLILMIISITLCLYKGDMKDDIVGSKNAPVNVNKNTTIWIICVTLSFIAGTGCSVVQKTQQMVFDGNYGQFLMVVSMAFAVILGLVNFFRCDKTGSKIMIKNTGYFPFVAAIFNGFVNLFVMRMVDTLPSALVYPVISVAGLAGMTLLSRFVFKEPMRWWQWIGVAIGATAVALLSL